MNELSSLSMMEKLLHSMDCYIYVTELKSDKILFVNDSMVKGFGLTGSLKGENCWKFFQSGFDKRCDFCPKNKLETNPDETIVWEERNTVTGRHYRHIDRIIDWPDGTKVHFQQCDDVTELKSATDLEKQLRQQTLMSSISRSFLSDTDIDALITENLHMVGEFMDIPQALFFRLEEDGVTLSCRNEWIHPKLGLGSRINSKMQLMGPMLSVMQAFKPGSGNDSCLHSNDPTIKEAMAPYRVSFNNYITTPVFLKGKLIAVIDFSREDDGRNWSKSDINLATFFANTLSGVFERDAMERQYSIVEKTPSIVLYADPNGNLAYSNPALVTATGYTAEEIKEGGFSLIFDEQTVHDIKELIIPQTLHNGLAHREVILRCKDGHERLLATTSFIVRKDTVAAIARDITEERILRAEMITAKELAEHASRAKSEFLSRMSHEMRTPMNAIIGMTVLARNTNDPEKKEDFLKNVDNASHHLLRLIDDVLNITKIENGDFFLVHSDFSFKAMLKKVLDVIHENAAEKSQAFSVEVDPSIPDELIGDEKRLAQAINNVLANAVKFTSEEGSVQVGICMLGEENGMITLQIEVTDSGIGISNLQQKTIFHLFEQEHGGIDRKFGGVGLGLFVAKRIVELMGGTISVESELGKGSKFTLTVKVEKKPQEKSRPEGADWAFGLGRPMPSFEGKTALLVEDMEINREIVMTLLGDTKINIECAENGREALDIFSADPGKFDIIFMDISMPEMDGVEATRRIRMLSPEGSRVPILAVTANVLPEEVEHYLAVGMNDHIGKPIEIDELLQKIEKYIN